MRSGCDHVDFYRLCVKDIHQLIEENCNAHCSNYEYSRTTSKWFGSHVPVPVVQINLLQMAERVISVLTVEQSKFIPKNMRLYTKNSIQVTSLFVTSVTPFVFEVDELWHFANW